MANENEQFNNQMLSMFSSDAPLGEDFDIGEFEAPSQDMSFIVNTKNESVEQAVEPQVQEATEIEAQEEIAPQVQEETVPQVQEEIASQTQEETAPQAQDAPQALEIPQTQEVESELSFEPVVAPKKEENWKDLTPKVGAPLQSGENLDMVTVSPVEFSSFDDEENILSDNLKQNLDILQDVKMRITVELGRARSSVKKILDFQKGSIVELNKVAGEQVELYANGKFVAYGEVIVIEDKFGLRVTSIARKPKIN